MALTQMKNPEQIALRRQQLERELESLDDQEQAWESLTRTQRLTELIHEVKCRKNHGTYSDYCQFHERSWENPDFSRSEWQRKVAEFLAVLPDDWTDAQIVTAARMAPK